MVRKGVRGCKSNYASQDRVTLLLHHQFGKQWSIPPLSVRGTVAGVTHSPLTSNEMTRECNCNCFLVDS